MKYTLSIFFLLLSPLLPAQTADSAWIVNNYYKMERMIPMRDGIKLFTSIYVPKDTTRKHPILLRRTPYSCAPYGEKEFKKDWWNFYYREYFKLGYIMVMQDVRGRYMSQGEYEDIRPFIPEKKSNEDVDEATDTYDAIEWLVKNVPHNNGNVGVYGVSYPGFYASMAALSGHPALKAVSPQAPVTDWFIGDDVHHNGAFFLLDCFSFDYSFGTPRSKPTTQDAPRFNYPTPDNYEFFLREGTLKNLTLKYMKDRKFWNQTMDHPVRDGFWKERTITYHFKNIKPAILVTGGLFDAEDLWGTWNTYKIIEKQSPGTVNKICMGPWFHGGWYRSDGSNLGNVRFGTKTSEYYYRNVEIPFFNYYLKDASVASSPRVEGAGSDLPEATIFFTGENAWRTFGEWPPKNMEQKPLYLNEQSALRFSKPITTSSYSEYMSDPARPVPYTEDVHIQRTREYMSDDQRFAARRPDVLTFKTEQLEEDLTLAGPVLAELFASITTTDADFVVKLIDVFPPVLKGEDSVLYAGSTYPMGEYQMLVRGEVLRGKFRNSLEKPEPFMPGQITQMKFELPDVAHTFRKGHRIMVQIQSSWFPLVDRNPQQFTDIYKCDESAFIKSTIRIYHDFKYASNLVLPVMKKQ